MSSWADIRPAGYAATAAGFLDEAATDADERDLAVRQLAALQGIGWALLALGDQLADGNDSAVTRGEHLADIAAAVEDLNRAPLAGPVRDVLDRLAWLRKGRLR